MRVSFDELQALHEARRHFERAHSVLDQNSLPWGFRRDQAMMELRDGLELLQEVGIDNTGDEG